ncbi:MAG: flippase-like domain-containing protein [Solirubrobacterales bacterium]|nr:flippase-like domain-containing protein [Solirubrobacterales bacterium]
MSTAGAPGATAGLKNGRRRGARELLRRNRRAISIVAFVLVAVCVVYFVLPQISGLSGTLWRLRHADPWWIAAAVGLETISLAGYGLLFRTVFSCHGVRIGWRESYQITLAGTVASKVLTTAGAGSVALTAWALRASGLSPRAIARRMLSFEMLRYFVFAGALLLVGIGLRTHVLAGRSPWTLTVVPAAGAGIAIVLIASLRALPRRFEQAIASGANSEHLVPRLLAHLAAAPRTLREASAVVSQLIGAKQLGLFGAVIYWGFDIATLWAALHAFGAPPPTGAIVMAYLIGQLANVLPLPGGVGGVEGGMIGGLLAFGTQGSLAVLGVLAYRLIAFWLPTLPGGIAYLRLRRTVGRWRELESPSVSAPSPSS